MSSFLREKEVVGLSFDGEAKLSTFHDGMYALITNNDVLYSFDAISLQKIVYDPPDKSIKSSVTSIALSPAHDQIAVGFLDGSIQTYQIPNPKPHKVISKARKAGGIISMVFIDQSTLLYMDTSANLVIFDTANVAANLFKAFTKEKVIGVLPTPGISLFAPPIYRNTSASTPKPSAKCTCPGFQDSFAVVTTSNTIVAQFADDKFNSLATFDESNAFIDMIMINETTIQLALFANSKLTIYLIKAGISPEIISEMEINESCALISFLNENVVTIVTQDNTCIYITISDKSQIKFSIKHEGQLLHTDDCLSVVSNEGRIFENFLPTFQDNFDDFRNADKLEEARQLCVRALAGETGTCIGLPQNPSQRFLVVQSMFMNFFEQSLREQIESEGNVEKLIDNCIAVSEEMKCNMWVTTKLQQIFKDEGKEKDYFKRIIEIDSEANKFSYSLKFFTDLIQQKDIPNVFDFISHLPVETAPPALVLKYAIEMKNTDLALDICLNRIHDIITTVSILYNDNKYSEVVNYLNSYINEENQKYNYTEKLITWLFSRSKEDQSFPRITTLIKNESNLDYFDKIYNHIKNTGKPISLDSFMNILVMIVNSENLGIKHKLFVLATSICIESDVKLMKTTLKIFLSSIFSREYAEPDQREKLLVALLQRGYLDKMMDTLMEMCESFKFKSARGIIMLKGNKYDAAIEEMLEDPASDVYSFINKMIAEKPECKPAIKTAIDKAPTLLLIKDPKQFFNLIFENFNDMVFKIPEMLGNPDYVNLYFRQLFSDPRTANFNITTEVASQYCEFICKYYPNDVLGFFQSRNDLVLTNYTNLCKESGITDALAYINVESGDFVSYQKNIVELITKTGVKYVDGSLDKEKATKTFEFIITTLQQCISKCRVKETKESILLNSIKALAPALYAVKDLNKEQKAERAPLISHTTHKIVSVATNVIAFDQILTFMINELAESKYGEAKESIMAVINDYAYDIDSDRSLSQLLQEDEMHTFENYILTNVKGFGYKNTTCCTCHKRLDAGSVAVRIFKCGHVFHDKAPCLTRDVCPICNAEQRLDDPIEPKNDDVKGVNNIVRRRLARFEADMAQEPIANAMVFGESNIDAAVDPPAVQCLPGMKM